MAILRGEVAMREDEVIGAPRGQGVAFAEARG